MPNMSISDHLDKLENFIAMAQVEIAAIRKEMNPTPLKGIKKQLFKAEEDRVMAKLALTRLKNFNKRNNK